MLVHVAMFPPRPTLAHHLFRGRSAAGQLTPPPPPNQSPYLRTPWRPSFNSRAAVLSPKDRPPSLSLPHSCFRKAWHASYNVGGGRHLPKCQAPVLFSDALAVVVFSRKDRPPPPCHRMDCMSSSRPAHPATSRYVADILETDLGWIVIRMGV